MHKEVVLCVEGMTQKHRQLGYRAQLFQQHTHKHTCTHVYIHVYKCRHFKETVCFFFLCTLAHEYSYVVSVGDMCTRVCVSTEARRRSWVFCSTAVHLIPLRQFFFFHQTWSLSGGQQALAICPPTFALRSVQVTRMFSHTRLCPWVLRISAYILTLIEQTFLPLEPSTLIWYYLLIFKTSENTIK